VGAITHGLLLALALSLLNLFLPEVRREASVQSGGALLGGIVAGFFCLVWPWLLTGLHRPNAERALRSILHEIVSAATARAA
jgi:hypothetical protein